DVCSSDLPSRSAASDRRAASRCTRPSRRGCAARATRIASPDGGPAGGRSAPRGLHGRAPMCTDRLRGSLVIDWYLPALFAAGLFWWTLLESLRHRFALHGLP